MREQEWYRISKSDFYYYGGFANPNLKRVANNRGIWAYFKLM